MKPAMTPSPAPATVDPEATAGSAGPHAPARAPGSRSAAEAARTDGAPAIRFYEGESIARERSVAWLMKQAVAGIGRTLNERMALIGVTDAQWPLLLVIGHGQQPTATEVARALAMDAGALTRMIDRLCDKGLVARGRCPADRRATRLSLTDSGRLAVGPINDVLADTLNDALRGFSPDEYAILVRLLRRLMANAQDMPPYRLDEPLTSGDRS